jgi:hypothetical protein
VGLPDVAGSDVAVPRYDVAAADVVDAVMPPPPDVAGADTLKMGLEAGSDALKPPLDGRDSNADGSGGDVGLDVRDAAVEAAGTEVGPVDAPTTTSEIARACALAASCSGYGSPTSASRCIAEFGATVSRRDDTNLDRLLSCARKTLGGDSRGCGTFVSCWGGDLFTLDSIVQGGRCSGTKVAYTPAGATSPLQLDCAVLGQECSDPMTGLQRAGCAAKSCLVSPVAAPSCEGTVASACAGYGPRSTVDCGRSGRTCQVSGQNAVCVGTGAACDTSEKVTCAGSEATYCAGGARATVDCATNSMATRCAAGASSSEPCATTGTACNPVTFVDVCSGAAMQVCVDGAIATIPCVDIGLASCQTPSGTSYARCEEGV